MNEMLCLSVFLLLFTFFLLSFFLSCWFLHMGNSGCEEELFSMELMSFQSAVLHKSSQHHPGNGSNDLIFINNMCDGDVLAKFGYSCHHTIEGSLL